ncbi:MAG: PilZ domain-containing protein [Terriglobales bacterium]
MLQTHEPRFRSHLPVLVVGTDTMGNPFKQTATVENVSRRGGLLTGIRCLRAPGDLVQLQHRGRKGHFRVVWIDLPSGRAGICSVDGPAPIWGSNLPEAAELPTPTPAPATEPPRLDPEPVPPPPVRHTLSPTNGGTRRFPRYRCMGGVDARVPGNATRLWGRLTVISLGGCYVETLSPFPITTKLELLIGGYGIEARIHGEVRYSQPRLGMGIVFTGMSDNNQRELERLIAAAAQRRN